MLLVLCALYDAIVIAVSLLMRYITMYDDDDNDNY